MPIAVWVSLLTLVVGTLVTLSVASMHRKQMRQIELHRVDPSVPLVPPPHPITRFLKTYGLYLFFALWNLVALILELRSAAPLTRWVVFEIMLSMLAAGAMLLLGFATYLFNSAMTSAERTLDVIEKMSDVVQEIAKRPG